MNLQPIKLPFGLRADGSLAHVEDVPRGAACGCVCPACERPLVAKQGDVRVPHFAHAADFDCEYAVEAALHLAAMDILARRRTLTLPASAPFTPIGMSRSVSALQPRRLVFDDVQLERREGSVVPDGIAVLGDYTLRVAIRLTHRITDEKLERLRELGQPAIELDLSRVDRKCLRADLERLIVEDPACKRWLVDVSGDEAIASIPELQGRVFALRYEPHGTPFVACSKWLWQNRPIWECRTCPHCLGVGPDPFAPEWAYCRLVGTHEPGWYPRPPVNPHAS